MMANVSFNGTHQKRHIPTQRLKEIVETGRVTDTGYSCLLRGESPAHLNVLTHQRLHDSSALGAPRHNRFLNTNNSSANGTYPP